MTNRFFRKWAALCVPLILASLALQAQAVSKPQTWKGNFTNSGAEELLHYRSGNFYLSAEGVDPTWSFAGSTNGYELGATGFYVSDLDGSGRTSVAFFDPAKSTWLWGTFSGKLLSWTPVGEMVNGKTIFHVGKGPTFYPVDQLKTTAQQQPAGETAATLPGQPSAAVTGAVTPIVYPAEGVQYTALARSQHVWTHFLLFSDGNVYATTRVKEDTWLGGFHAGVSVAVYSELDKVIPLWRVDIPSPIGVTGTLWGHSDVTVSWQGAVPSQLLPFVRYYAVVQEWSPNWYTAIANASKFADYASSIIKPFTSFK
jgi:hypothetical protein